MNLSTPEQRETAAEQGASAPQDRAVLCHKCEHLNRWGVNSCTRCGAHLYVSCNSCGEKNERVRTRCQKCGRRLHRGLADQVTSRFPRKKVKLNVLNIILFIIVVSIAYQAIQYFAQMPGD